MTLVAGRTFDICTSRAIFVVDFVTRKSFRALDSLYTTRQTLNPA